MVHQTATPKVMEAIDESARDTPVRFSLDRWAFMR